MTACPAPYECTTPVMQRDALWESSGGGGAIASLRGKGTGGEEGRKLAAAW